MFGRQTLSCYASLYIWSMYKALFNLRMIQLNGNIYIRATKFTMGDVSEVVIFSGDCLVGLVQKKKMC